MNAGPASSIDESALILLAKAGNSQALERLLRQYRSSIERVCRRLCRDDSVHEDIVQETCMAIVHHIPSFRGECGFMTWVYRLARTHRSRALRTAARCERQRIALEARSPVLERLLPDDVLARDELLAAFEQAMGPLKPLDRRIAWLANAEGFSASEIASELNLSIPAVKTRLHRARSILRRQMNSIHSTKCPGPTPVAPARQPTIG